MKSILSFLHFLLIAALVEAGNQPNIVMILADDMGYGDLSCYGHPKAKTPIIDNLAKEGIRFTQHYSNGTECSPTRTAFLTGKYQQRAGGLECAIGTGNVGRYDDAIALAEARSLGLPGKQTVIPGKLKEQGYKCGVFGKWHLGYEPKFNPMEHGWDAFFGYMGGNVHYFNHKELSDLHVLYRGRLPVYAEGYMSDLITKESVQFIEENKAEPFFLFISHECPHFPFQGPADSEKDINASNWTSPDEETYVTMLEDLDDQVGKVLTALDDKEVADNTIVIFVSDNGGYGKIANMGPLRGSKSTTFEGGIRVPLIIRWPGKIEAGLTSTQVCTTFDLTYSFLKLAGVKDEGFTTLEGVDILRHISEKKPDFSRTLFWRGKRGTRVWSAVREDNMKYVRKVEDGQMEEWLFDLSEDIGEENDLGNTQGDLQAKLRSRLLDWEKEVRAVR
jgi:arylsulfatase A-like enzyme